MRKLSYVQAKNAVIVAFILGLIFSIVQIGIDLRNERNTLDHQVSRMLETIKSSAARAVFSVDRDLAENVVDSLLKFLPIYSATLTDDFGEILASRDKEHVQTGYHWLTENLEIYRSNYTLELFAEESNNNLGHIDVKVYGHQIVENFVNRSIRVILFGTLRNFLLAIVLTLVFHYTLTRPLILMTGQISRRAPLDAAEKPVDIPAGHERDELGELAGKLNYYLETTTRLFLELTEAEEKTRASEARFRNLAETSSDWFWETGPDLRFLQIEGNADIWTPTGKTRKEALEGRLPDFEAINMEKWENHFSDMDQHKRIRDFQYAVLGADNEVRYFRFNGKPVFDKDGSFSGYQGTGSDVTEEARSKRALEESEARYRMIFNNAQLGIARSNLSDGRIIEANERAAEILGYESADDLITNYGGTEAWVVTEQRDKMMEAILEDGYILELQAEIRCPDGSHRWIRSSLTADMEEGVIDSFFVDATEHINALDDLAKLNAELELQVATRTRALSEEIMERTRAEGARRKSEERLLTAIESISDGFLLFDSEDRLVMANSRMQEFFLGAEGSFVPGRTFEEITHDILAKGLFPDAVGREDEWYVDRLADRTENFTLTKELKTSAGLWLRMTDTRTPDGGWVGLRTDITELRQALDDLEAAQGSLMQKERLAALGQLAATVSHELRNPLGAMQTSTYFLRHQLPDAGEKEVQALERIERNIHRCDRIIDELLDFTRQRDLDTRQTEFNSWLREVLAELNLPAEVTIIEDFAAENPVIPLDGEYFRRVIVNLFDNACQAMTSMDGSASLTERNLTISTSVAAEGLVLTFRDTGVGMSPDVRNRIFEPMFSTKGFGVGLGLAMAEQIIKRHRATIRVSSEPGAGTEITVILPLSEG